VFHVRRQIGLVSKILGRDHYIAKKTWFFPFQLSRMMGKMITGWPG
jgi:hypothetical protein